MLVLSIGLAIGWRDDFIPLPLDIPGPVAGLLRASLALIAAVLASLPFVLDRLLAARLQGAPRMLVYPLAAVTVDYVASVTIHPVGGTSAYGQYGDLPVMQLLSLTEM